MRLYDFLLENTAVNLSNRTGENNQKDSFDEWWNHEVEMNMPYHQQLLSRLLPAIKKKYLAAIFSLANKNDDTGIVGTITPNRPPAFSINPNPVNDDFYQIMLAGNDSARRQNVYIRRDIVDNDPKMSAALQKGYLYYIELQNLKTTNLIDFFHALETLAELSIKKPGDVAKDQANRISSSNMTDEQKRIAYSELKTATNRYAKDVQQAAKNKLNSITQNKTFFDMYTDVIESRNKFVELTGQVFKSGGGQDQDSGLQQVYQGNNISIFLISSEEVAIKEGKNLKNCIGSYYKFNSETGHFMSGNVAFDIFVCKENQEMVTKAAFRMDTNHKTLYELKGYSNQPPHPDVSKDVVAYLEGTGNIKYEPTGKRDLESSGLYYESSSKSWKSYDEIVNFKDIDTLENGDLVSVIDNIDNIPSKILEAIIPDYNASAYFSTDSGNYHMDKEREEYLKEYGVDRYNLLFIRSPQKSIQFVVVTSRGLNNTNSISVRTISGINTNQVQDFEGNYAQNPTRTINKYSKIIKYLYEKGYANTMAKSWEEILQKAGHTVSDDGTLQTLDEAYPPKFIVKSGELSVYNITIPESIVRNIRDYYALIPFYSSARSENDFYLVYKNDELAFAFIVRGNDDEEQDLYIVASGGKGVPRASEEHPGRLYDSNKKGEVLAKYDLDPDSVSKMFIEFAKIRFGEEAARKILHSSFAKGLSELHTSKMYYEFAKEDYIKRFLDFTKEAGQEAAHLPLSDMYWRFPALIKNYDTLDPKLKKIIKEYIDVTKRFPSYELDTGDKMFIFDPNIYDAMPIDKLTNDFINSDLYQIHADGVALFVNSFLTQVKEKLMSDEKTIKNEFKLEKNDWANKLNKTASRSKKYGKMLIENLNDINKHFNYYVKKLLQHTNMGKVTQGGNILLNLSNSLKGTEGDKNNILKNLLSWQGINPVYAQVAANPKMQELRKRTMSVTLEYRGVQNEDKDWYKFKILNSNSNNDIPDLIFDHVTLNYVKDNIISNSYKTYREKYWGDSPNSLSNLRGQFPVVDQKNNMIAVKFTESSFAYNVIRPLQIGHEINSVNLIYVDNSEFKKWFESKEVIELLKTKDKNLVMQEAFRSKRYLEELLNQLGQTIQNNMSNVSSSIAMLQGKENVNL